MDFLDQLEEAEAGFRATRLQRLVDAAEKSKVKIRKTVRTMGDGDDQKTFQEVVEDTVLPDPKWDAWLLERKFPEEYSRKHLDVTATVTNTEPPSPMHLVIVDPVKKREDAEADAPLTSNGLKGVSRAVAPQIWRGMWSDGGHRGAMSNRRGAVFRRRTLEWVVRNIPLLINGLV